MKKVVKPVKDGTLVKEKPAEKFWWIYLKRPSRESVERQDEFLGWMFKPCSCCCGNKVRRKKSEAR